MVRLKILVSAGQSRPSPPFQSLTQHRALEKVAKVVNDNRGSAHILAAYSKRHDWSAVRVLYLKPDPSLQHT